MGPTSARGCPWRSRRAERRRVTSWSARPEHRVSRRLCGRGRGHSGGRRAVDGAVEPRVPGWPLGGPRAEGRLARRRGSAPPQPRGEVAPRPSRCSCARSSKRAFPSIRPWTRRRSRRSQTAAANDSPARRVHPGGAAAGRRQPTQPIAPGLLRLAGPPRLLVVYLGRVYFLPCAREVFLSFAPGATGIGRACEVPSIARETRWRSTSSPQSPAEPPLTALRDEAQAPGRQTK